MKGDFKEILIPIRREYSNNTEAMTNSNNNGEVTVWKTIAALAILVLVGFSMMRHENKIFELEVRLNKLEMDNSKNFEPETVETTGDKERKKREVSNGVPAWVKRTAEGEPILNEEYLEWIQRQTSQSGNQRGETSQLKERSGSSSRRSASSSRQSAGTGSSSTRQEIIRNHEDETFFTKPEDGGFRPSGLKEIFERLPPASDEDDQVQYSTRASNIIETRSRLTNTELESSPPVQQVGSGLNQVSARIVRFNDDGDDSDEVKHSSKVSSGTEEAIAGHFVADVSNFTSTENPRLRNSNGIFQIWRQAKWMNKDKAERWFKLDGQDGTVTIQLGGLYQIYSQIHYHDEHAENSFVVEVNEEAILQCTTTKDAHSCFTSGLTSLSPGDRMLIKNVGADRFSIYKPEKSFFGLVRVGNAP